MNQPLRRSYGKSSGFGPAIMRETVPVPLAIDNMVCGVCGQPLGAVAWIAVSTPKRKGIVIFACVGHMGKAMNMLAELVDGLAKVPTDIKLPDEKEN